MAESAVLHLARVRERASACPARLRDPVLAGAMLPAAWLQQAQRLRRWYGLRVAELLRELDVLVAPATPCSAPPHGTESLALAGRELPVDAALGVLAQPFSFIGLPVVVVPIWPPGASLPVGVQLVGAPWREDVLLRVAQHLQAGGIARAPPAPVSEPALRAAQRTSAGS
jgi:Asp-tRNA(Asn)/Glu-tRNA(Gln) amidotransferase A subunit family amidase